MTIEQKDATTKANLHNKYLDYINKVLHQVIDNYFFLCPKLSQAVRYSLFSGGKRIRPLLVLGAANCVGVSIKDIAIAACAVEFMHTYSLIHDDLPDMDNDEFRRGKKTCHIVYGSTTAILAGDALQCLAFEVITNEKLYPDSNMTAVERLNLAKLLSTASGAQGMVGGQSLDCYADEDKLNLQDLQIIHENKTGALMQASVAMGLVRNTDITSEKMQYISNKLIAFSKKFGALFQAYDDIKDECTDKNSNRKQLSLTSGSSTPPSIAKLLDLSDAYEYTRKLQKQVLQELDELGEKADFLRQLVIDIIPI